MKLGRKFRGEHIICQAHEIHLGIVKSLYCTRINEGSYSSESCSSESCSKEKMSIEVSEELPRIKMEPSYRPLITKIRKFIKSIKFICVKKVYLGGIEL